MNLYLHKKVKKNQKVIFDVWNRTRHCRLIDISINQYVMLIEKQIKSKLLTI